MHFLIISAAAGTPGLALASQPKFAELQGTLYSEELQADVLTRDFARPGELARAVVQPRKARRVDRAPTDLRSDRDGP